MADRYALIDPDGQVENIILWDGKSAYPIPDGYTLRPARKNDRMQAAETPVDNTASLLAVIEAAPDFATLKNLLRGRRR